MLLVGGAFADRKKCLASIKARYFLSSRATISFSRMIVS
jgi:hypothetical protein